MTRGFYNYDTRGTPVYLQQCHRDRMITRLSNALDFLDKAREDKNAGPTGALRDAVEWVESAARDVVSAQQSLGPLVEIEQ